MKTVLITGVSRGIGKSLAEIFLAHDYSVIGTSTNGKTNITHKNLKKFPLDLSSPKNIETCVSQIKQRVKKIDILINNAGIWGGIEDDPTLYEKMFRKVMEVNVFGTTKFTELVLPLISTGGHIVNVSSRQGSMSYVNEPMYPDYKISKAALNMYTRILAARLRGKITVSSVHPGWVKTDMGGEGAEMEPEEAAKYIFTLATSDVETGQFWFKGKKFTW